MTLRARGQATGRLRGGSDFTRTESLSQSALVERLASGGQPHNVLLASGNRLDAWAIPPDRPIVGAAMRTGRDHACWPSSPYGKEVAEMNIRRRGCRVGRQSKGGGTPRTKKDKPSSVENYLRTLSRLRTAPELPIGLHAARTPEIAAKVRSDRVEMTSDLDAAAHPGGGEELYPRIQQGRDTTSAVRRIQRRDSFRAARRSCPNRSLFKVVHVSQSTVIAYRAVKTGTRL